MKNLILLCALCLFTGCSTHLGYKIKGEGKNCFSKKELTTLIENEVSKNVDKTTALSILPIVANKKNCIGLYGYVFKNSTSPHRVIQKALKFDDKIIIYLLNNSRSNEFALNEFIYRYKDSFTDEQITELSKKFMNGTETDARLY